MYSGIVDDIYVYVLVCGWVCLFWEGPRKIVQEELNFKGEIKSKGEN